ncbi:MAG: GEVED domain-containing protein, partial [Bacteroidetes bacterium]|nr:GEVED domain-containing protein [Bacteroidota bacterium]
MRTLLRRRLIASTLALIIGLIGVNMAQAQYCNPTYSIGCSDDDGINNFSFAGIVNNNSGCNNGQGNAYTYFSAIQGQVTGGSTYTISMQSISPTWSEGFAVWIDYDQNGKFDATEKIYSSPTTGTSATTFTGPITIPASALPGTTRLRVVCQYATIPTDPCVSGSFGEAEDYPLMILGASVQAVYPGQGSILQINTVYDGTNGNLKPSVTLGRLPASSSITQRFSYKIKVVNAGNAQTGTVVYEMLDPVTNSTTITNLPAVPPDPTVYVAQKAQGPWAGSNGTFYTNPAFFVAGTYRTEVVHELVDASNNVIFSQNVAATFVVAVDRDIAATSIESPLPMNRQRYIRSTGGNNNSIPIRVRYTNFGLETVKRYRATVTIRRAS